MNFLRALLTDIFYRSDGFAPQGSAQACSLPADYHKYYGSSRFLVVQA